MTRRPRAVAQPPSPPPSPPSPPPLPPIAQWLAKLARPTGLEWLWRNTGCAWLWHHAFNDHVPMAWHIVVVLAAAAGTYAIAPDINERFERQKIQASYISDNLKELNSTISELYVATSAIMNAPDNQDVASDNLEKLDEAYAKLSWKALQISAVLKSKEDRALMQRFQAQLGQVTKAARSRKGSVGRERLKTELQKFTLTTVQVIAAVSERSTLGGRLASPLPN